MITQTYPALSQFLGADLHQDWPEEFSTPEAAVEEFRRREPADSVRALSAELEQAIREAQQSADPSRLLSNLGCYYKPQADGRSVSAWLAPVRKTLSA
ncbi:MAG: hypothetical protein K2X38_21370 [Gemmataceae bacterium]|nr:hypothetical protein [Gemmataceae bacterium]